MHIFSVVQSVFSLLTISIVLMTTAVYAQEKFSEFSDYQNYYTVIPFKSAFKNGEQIRFYSFAHSVEPVNHSWEEITFCTSDGVLVKAPTDVSSETDYFVDNVYPPAIQELLISIDASDAPPTQEQEHILRSYANSDADMNPWTMAITVADNSVCSTRHDITIYTPVFNIPKTYTVLSSEWTYGTID